MYVLNPDTDTISCLVWVRVCLIRVENLISKWYVEYKDCVCIIMGLWSVAK